MNRKLNAALFAAGIVCLAMALYYFAQVVWHGLWSDTPFRTVNILLTFMGITFMALAKIIGSQEKIIRLLENRKKGNDNV
jgi:hypothetical protein